MRTICFFTGTRAEYGLLRPLIQAVKAHPDMHAKLLVSGMHLADSCGATWHEIENDGLAIDEKIEILLDSSSDTGICTAMGLGMMRYGDALKRLAPDCMVVLGDRFEALAATIAATVCRIPVAHLHGGELTLGAMDDAFRHAMTKMSQLHFTSTDAYRQRVIQLGEQPERVFHVGALGVENIRTLDLLPRDEVERRLGLTPGQRFLLVTYHPATLDREAPESQLEALLQALAAFPDHVAVFTGANADAGGGALNRILADHVGRDPSRLRFFMSLGSLLYLSAARQADAVVGNSSSAIIEVPSLGTPSVDIGSRQAGRISATSVLHCPPRRDEITAAITQAISPDFRRAAANVVNPYEKAGTTQAIVESLVEWDGNSETHKSFYDFPSTAVDAVEKSG